MDEHEQKRSEDPDDAGATVLPAREAMSIITQDASGQEDASSEDERDTPSSGK